MNKKIAFGYYGGKYSHLDWLLPLLPINGITHYCEPFAGSGAVLLNREPAPIETYNDLDGEIVNFFKVLRTDKDALIERLAMTPFSRAEFADAIPPDTTLSDLERARRFYVVIRQCQMNQPVNSPGRWGYVINESRNGMGSRVSSFYNGLDNLGEVAMRLLRVQIECLPALDIIGRYDTSETLFYCDPPYTHDTRNSTDTYIHEMDTQQHIELLQSLRACKGKVALSGYDNPLYAEMLSDWYLNIAPVRKLASSGQETAKAECLWTNYNTATVQNDLSGLPMFEILK